MYTSPDVVCRFARGPAARRARRARGREVDQCSMMTGPGAGADWRSSAGKELQAEEGCVASTMTWPWRSA